MDIPLSYLISRVTCPLMRQRSRGSMFKKLTISLVIVCLQFGIIRSCVINVCQEKLFGVQNNVTCNFALCIYIWNDIHIPCITAMHCVFPIRSGLSDRSSPINRRHIPIIPNKSVPLNHIQLPTDNPPNKIEMQALLSMCQHQMLLFRRMWYLV